jgi:hypothetical protein
MYYCTRCEYKTIFKQNLNIHMEKTPCTSPNDTRQHSFYIVDSDPHIHNKSLKIGFVTTSHKDLFKRYQTCFGKRMIIYAFVCYHKSGREVETDFKNEFKHNHDTLELYEKKALPEYIKWAIEQCVNMQTLTVINTGSLSQKELKIEYEKQEQIRIQEQHNTYDITNLFEKIENSNKYKCKDCSKILLEGSLKRHQIYCKGPLHKLQCKYCERFFAFSSSKCVHQKGCKMNTTNK